MPFVRLSLLVPSLLPCAAGRVAAISPAVPDTAVTFRDYLGQQQTDVYVLDSLPGEAQLEQCKVLIVDNHRHTVINTCMRQQLCLVLILPHVQT